MAFLSKTKGPGNKKTALASDTEKGHPSLNEERKLPTTEKHKSVSTDENDLGEAKKQTASKCTVY